MTQKTGGRLLYADVLRIFAAIAVIILHTSSFDWYSTPVSSYEWKIFNVYDSATRWCVPVFLMLSGMLFLNVEKPMPTSRIYLKYIPRILSALVFWGVFYGIYNLIILSVDGYEAFTAADAIEIAKKFIFGPPWYHLWYLYAIIALYILTPIFRVFMAAATRKDIEYLLIVFFLFGLVLPMVKKVLLDFDATYKINFSIIELTGYAGYFFAGFYFAKYDIPKQLKNAIYILGVVSVVWTIVITSTISRASGKPDGYWYGYLLPTTMFTSYALFIAFKDVVGKIDFSEKSQSFILHLSSCTFGIYLVHDVILKLFWRYGFSASAFNPLVSIPLITASCFLISWAIVIVLKKIPLLSRNIL